MLIASNGDNFHETSNPTFFVVVVILKNKKKSITYLSSAELPQRVVKVNLVLGKKFHIFCVSPTKFSI